MTPETLWEQFPFLWHMAEPGTWPSIRDNGLLSTSALLDCLNVTGNRRIEIEANRRPRSVELEGNGTSKIVIRDNKPMTDSALEKCLEDGLTPTDWYMMLNARTFFWLSQERLRSLLRARAYRNRRHTILTVETRTLVESHLDRIELSPINSGSTLYRPVRRGKQTFLPIDQYDYDGWRKKRRAENAIVELVVQGGVPDIRDHVIAVHEWDAGVAEEKWRRNGADPSIGP